MDDFLQEPEVENNLCPGNKPSFDPNLALMKSNHFRIKQLDTVVSTRAIVIDVVTDMHEALLGLAPPRPN